jgi:lipopolysaccharide/colanic/teichoic acid biosynthesis glycosyltransferase
VTKIDELPQLINVLVGDMSLVGPRPEVRKYVEMFRNDYEEILRVRPGITDPASIKYRNEAEILGRAADPEKEYVCRILPEKIRLAKEYARNSSLGLDLMILLKTMHVVARKGGSCG